MIGKHKALRKEVVIKAIPLDLYHEKSTIFSISEVDAQNLCHKSKYVLQIMDFFEFDGSAYIVAKFEAGGDLVQYVEARGQEYLTEKQARQIFV